MDYDNNSDYGYGDDDNSYKDILVKWDRKLKGKPIRFPKISPRTYEHPADKAALTSLRSVPGLDRLIRAMSGLFGERRLRLLYLGTTVKVDKDQYASLYKMYLDCLETLDFDYEPELYVSQTPIVNAGAVGIDRPFIVLNSGTIQLLNPEELQVVIGHELGHILSQHVLYKTMLAILLSESFKIFGYPFGIPMMALIVALKEWDRKSELSADRASLLVVQDPTLCYRTWVKIASGCSSNEVNLEAYFRQAEEYNQGGDNLDKVYKLLNIMYRSHPIIATRAIELRKWVENGSYQKIIDGEYIKRADEKGTSFAEDLKEAGKEYAEGFEDSLSQLQNIMSGVGENIQQFGKKVKERFGKLFES